MTERERPAERVDAMRMRSALVDRVTRLPSVAYVVDELRVMLDARRRLGVLHLRITDIDLVERLYGWQVFDRVVARAAEELRRAAAELVPGALLAIDRVAGAGLVVFVPEGSDGAEVDGESLQRVAARLARRLDAAFDDDALDGLNPGLGFRAGHALLGENPFFRFERRVHEAVEIAGALRERIERGHDDAWRDQVHEILRDASIETLFQPIVRLDNREILGYEALSRGPRETVFEMPRPLFELSSRYGAADRVDRLCCEHAMADFGRCARHGKLFVNMLPESLSDAGESWRVTKLPVLLAEAAVAPGDLVVELSERRTGADEARAAEAADALREVGCRIALDDVGTGGMPARVVERIRPDYLKLDGSLVRDVQRNLIKQEVLRTVVELARSIDAAVIAEGVEAPAEADALAGAGADYAQGFLFASPLPVERMADGPPVAERRP